jgi:hypothetical protein
MAPSVQGSMQEAVIATHEETTSVSVSPDELSHESDPYFFSVSITKLVVLSLCTFGLYPIYWFYKHWKCVRNHEMTPLSPFWRAVLTNIYCYALFRRVIERVGGYEVPSLFAGPLTVGWIVTTLLWKLPDPYWLVSLCAFLFLIPVQVLANRVNRQHVPTLKPDNMFGVWQIVTIVVGGLLLIFGVVGTFMPPE